MLAALSPARRRLVLGVLAVVVVALVAIVALLVVAGGDDDATTVDQAELGPVLLVPGYGGDAPSLAALASVLRATGRDVTVVEPPGDGTGDLRDTATVIGADAGAAMTRTEASSVDLVGYSAGGVAARYWIAHGGASQVRRIVTLSAPHHGTELGDVAAAGDIACGVGCRQLATGSDLLTALNAGDETPTGPTWVSIWTTVDETVVPADSASLDGALNMTVQSVCADAAPRHSAMPDDRLVQAMVVAELAAGEPVPLDADDCDRLSTR